MYNQLKAIKYLIDNSVYTDEWTENWYVARSYGGDEF